MRRFQEQRRDQGEKSNRRAYELVLRGPDGRPRCERFANAAAYRARLVSLEHAEHRSLSIDELAGLLDS
ncbi:MAG TPA: hypothetical protein VM818_05570 [Vicinamibacterales bacterium]|nr:hypothetical protein [Vicinamibacterales bacterium]